MAIPVTGDGDNFLQWRNNTNQTAQDLGDKALLDLTPIGEPGPESDVVSALNKVAQAVADSGGAAGQDAIIYAIALG